MLLLCYTLRFFWCLNSSSASHQETAVSGSSFGIFATKNTLCPHRRIIGRCDRHLFVRLHRGVYCTIFNSTLKKTSSKLHKNIKNLKIKNRTNLLCSQSNLVQKNVFPCQEEPLLFMNDLLSSCTVRRKELIHRIFKNGQAVCWQRGWSGIMVALRVAARKPRSLLTWCQFAPHIDGLNRLCYPWALCRGS